MCACASGLSSCNGHGSKLGLSDGSLGLSVLARFVLMLVSDSSSSLLRVLSGLLRFGGRSGVDGDDEEEEEDVALVLAV